MSDKKFDAGYDIRVKEASDDYAITYNQKELAKRLERIIELLEENNKKLEKLYLATG